ncbi:MAG: ABC transporter permease subunit, partial [Pseudomonadota bacterium]
MNDGVTHDETVNPLIETDAEKVAAQEAERQAEVAEFVRTNPDYYAAQFKHIGADARFTPTFNLFAGIFGPIWFGARGLWKWAVAFLIVETFAFVQIARGLFGDLGADARARIESIAGTLELRKQQLAAAIENNTDRVDALKRNIAAIEGNIEGFRADAAGLEAEGPWIALTGLVVLVIAKAIQSVVANSVLESRFSEWLSDTTLSSGMPARHIALSAVFCVLIAVTAMVHYSFPGAFPILTDFPTDGEIRLTGVRWVEEFIAWCVRNSEALFDAITFGIRGLLDALEVMFVETPWMVIAAFIILVTWLTAGVRTAIFSGAFLAYMGLLGFWEKAMTTLALLGTAACLSIVIGIPLGMYCARRPRFYSVIQPIMDFMQTMPAFVFMVPVIAFFGVGKPAAVIVTMIFGGTPVVRLTVLGLRGVPEHVREAAISFGASKFYLLTKVDLPLAAPSIRAGINQTIMLSLAMVVVASLIGAKGLGEDVLEA